MSRFVFFDRKLTSHVNFSNFQAEEVFHFHFQNFGDVSIRKEQQQPCSLTNFDKIWSEHVLKIKTKDKN